MSPEEMMENRKNNFWLKQQSLARNATKSNEEGCAQGTLLGKVGTKREAADFPINGSFTKV